MMEVVLVVSTLCVFGAVLHVQACQLLANLSIMASEFWCLRVQLDQAAGCTLTGLR
jgi:hypothetical protein